jgi:RNA polymerase sigma factor (sigma-70 family)
VPSLEEFHAVNGVALARLAYLLTGDYHGAEDLMQDCWLTLTRHEARFAASNSPLAYARRVLVNAFLADKRRHRVPEAPMPEGQDLIGDDSPEIQVAEHDELWSRVLELPRRERATLVLTYYEDLDDRDAATVLQCRPATVRATRSRALARLRAQNIAEVTP